MADTKHERFRTEWWQAFGERSLLFIIIIIIIIVIVIGFCDLMAYLQKREDLHIIRNNLLF